MQNEAGEAEAGTGKRSKWRRILFALAIAAAIGSAAVWLTFRPESRNVIGGPVIGPVAHSTTARQSQSFKPTEAQWAGLAVEEISTRTFRPEVVTDGRIAIDEDVATPVFSPYAGLVRKLAAQPGQQVKAGQLLFTIEATDMIQAQNDFVVATSALATAQSQLKLATITEQRQKELFKATAGSLKDWQQAQTDLATAKNGIRAAEIALEAVRNRLRILKKTDAEIDAFQKTGKINPETQIYAPISGTVVQRKVGPGQYISSGASEPVFVIGDLSKVWLIANVPEATALNVSIGQEIEFQVLADTERVFSGKLNFVSSAMDPATRRLAVRAAIDNPEHILKPEMFARVTILTGKNQTAPAVPASAIVYEGDAAHVWVVGDDQTLSYRAIKTGLTSGNYVEARKGIAAGEKVIVKGALFIDRASS